MLWVSLFAFLFFPTSVFAEILGELLWEGGMPSKQEIRRARHLLLPEVPLNGKVRPNHIKMAVIDSGVATTHPQLGGFILDTTDFTGEGLEDVLGHGTAVALVAVFGQNRVAAPIGIVSAKVVNQAGKIRQKDVIKAIDWAAELGAKVINLSLGFKGDREDFKSLCDSIAGYTEIIFVAAAGNSGPNVKVYPANCGSPNLISVEATDDSGVPLRNTGRGDVAAPGIVKYLEEWQYFYEEGQRLAREGRFREARLMYERASKAEPNPLSEFQVGLIDLNGGKIEAAIQHFKVAIQIDPSIPEVHDSLGSALFYQGKYELAERSYREAILLFGDNPLTYKWRARTHFNLAQTLGQLGQNKEAEKELAKVKEYDPDYRTPNTSQ